MAEALAVPEFRVFSPTKRVDVLVADWKAELADLPELSREEAERRLYGRAVEAYAEGDYAFGAWCWFECDRLTNAFGGRVAEVTRVLGEGRYLGFSHRRAIADRVPMERVYRPRKGDMSTPRPEAVVLPAYQLLCVYALRAENGEAASRAQLGIALTELEERRRADPYTRHFETFRQLLERSKSARRPVAAPPAGAPEAAAPPAAPRPRRSAKGPK